MLLLKAHHFIKPFSTSATKASVTWRNHIRQTQLLHQISSILLQRHNWPSLLQNLNLSSKLTPSLFIQVLNKTQHNPQLCLSFFNWTKTNLHFKPDLISQCHIIHLALVSGQTQLVKQILGALIQTHTATVLIHSMIQVCKGRDSQSDAFSFVLECYSLKGFYTDGLEVYKMMRIYGCVPSTRACNKLLGALYNVDEFRLAWCLYSAMIRDGVLPDKYTWSLFAQILCKNGKFEMVLRLLDSGIYNSVMYNLVVDCYSRSGDFTAAFERLNEMCECRKLNPGFSTYSSILDGACKYENAEVAERMMGIMVEKRLLPRGHVTGNDSIIQKLCDLGKVYAAEMIFKRACAEKSGLHDDTYGYMLRALSKEGRVEEAISIYRIIGERVITIENSSYHAFVNVLCKEDESEGVWELLRDIIRRGYSPSAMDLSKFVASQCGKGRWREVEELLNVILEKDVLLDSLCCCSLMEHYCSTGQMDKAVAMHNKMENLNGSLDVKTYNILLDGLFKGGRINEAVRVFDYMNIINVVSSSSFTIMINGLCCVNELRKAMKFHDEMLKMGLKPDEATYKQLISGFK